MEIILQILPATITAMLALFGAYYGASRAADAQMKTAALNVFLTARLDAYKGFQAALENWSKEQTPETTDALYHAVNNVSLVASKETIQLLEKLQTLIHEQEKSGSLLDLKAFKTAHGLVLKSMHIDLRKYPPIEIEPKSASYTD